MLLALSNLTRRALFAVILHAKLAPETHPPQLCLRNCLFWGVLGDALKILMIDLVDGGSVGGKASLLCLLGVVIVVEELVGLQIEYEIIDGVAIIPEEEGVAVGDR